MGAYDLLPFDSTEAAKSIIKVIGVGGGGSNAVNYMYKQGIDGVDFMVCNTDQQALAKSPVPTKLQLGITITEGLGAGSKPETGKQAAIESREDIIKILSNGTKMVFITAGMGGGTGTGAAPEIAKIAQELDILTVGIVTLPFNHEGVKRIEQAYFGLKELEANVDALLVISNESLKEIFPDLPLLGAFNKADDVLTIAAKGIAEIITRPGLVNTDFADVNTVMRKSGVALMGSARSSGPDRARDAIEAALECPLLNNNNINGARNVLIHLSAGAKPISMVEYGAIMDTISHRAGAAVEQVINGIGHDDSLGDDIQVTIVATGFGSASLPQNGGNRNMQQPQQQQQMGYPQQPQNFQNSYQGMPQQGAQAGYGQQPQYQQPQQNMPNPNYPNTNQNPQNNYNSAPQSGAPVGKDVENRGYEELYGRAASTDMLTQQRSANQGNSRPRNTQYNADDEAFMEKLRQVPAFNMHNNAINNTNGPDIYGRSGIGSNGQIINDLPYLHDNKD